MNALLRLVALLQLQKPIALAKAAQSVSPPALRAHEVQPEVIQVGFGPFRCQFSVAADANPHGASIYPRAALRACGGA